MPDHSLCFAVIADDYTGAADLASMLDLAGVPAVLVFGVPDDPAQAAAAAGGGAVIAALKTRSVPPEAAVDASLRALRQLQKLRPRQVQFKYCSTFDSTPRGNIGPVTEALLKAVQAACTIAVPALPVYGRTQYLGHLFVEGRLLSESPLRHHPLNPMTDPDLVRMMSLQTSLRVGLVPLPAVLAGPSRIRQTLRELRDEGARIVLVDAVTEENLDAIADAVNDMPLITGASGISLALARLWRRQGMLLAAPAMPPPTPARGILILAGSCSAATIRQLERWEAAGHSVLRVLEPSEAVRAADWVREEIQRTGIATVASSAHPAARLADQEAGRAFEQAFAALSARMVGEGLVDTLIVAGGETSGAVVNALAVQTARVAAVIAPGVPLLVTLDGRLRLVLKSGNFGGPDFFADALRQWVPPCS